MINKVWKDKDKNKEIAKVAIDEDMGIEVLLSPETNGLVAKEMIELQSLAMFPPVDENKINGSESDDGWIRYQFKKGTNWSRAKQEIVATLDFLLNNDIQNQIEL